MVAMPIFEEELELPADPNNGHRFPDWVYTEELVAGRIKPEQLAIFSRYGGMRLRLPRTARFQYVSANKYRQTHGEHPDCVAIYRTPADGAKLGLEDTILVSFQQALAICSPDNDSLVHQTSQYCSWRPVAKGEVDYRNGHTFVIELQGMDINGETFDLGRQRVFLPDTMTDWLVYPNAPLGKCPAYPERTKEMSDADWALYRSIVYRRRGTFFAIRAARTAYELVVAANGQGFQTIADVDWFMAHTGASRFANREGYRMSILNSMQIAAKVKIAPKRTKSAEGKWEPTVGLVNDLDQMRAMMADGVAPKASEDFTFALYRDLLSFRVYRAFKTEDRKRRQVEYRASHPRQESLESAEQDTADIPF